MTETFIHRHLYFRVTYPDSAHCFPSIECFVYEGKNLSDEDGGDVWYFQPAADYARSGPILESGGGERRVVCVTGQNAASMMDVDELGAEIRAAQRRLERKRPTRTDGH